jgi:type IV fimbrial biogenesis protein FimT
MQYRSLHTPEAGYTIFELVVTLALVGILAGLAIAGLHGYVRQSQNAAAMIQGFVKQVRAKAIARTAAYRITASSLGELSTSFANRCSDTSFAPDESLVLHLPPYTRFAEIGWSVCVNSRGLATPNVTITVDADDGESTRVEIMLGGATRQL